MKIYENGTYRNMTDEEIAEMECQQLEYEQHKYDGISYEEIVSTLIREKYSIDDELAIQRQRDNKTDEFGQYYAFCEECKAKAKELVAEEGDTE